MCSSKFTLEYIAMIETRQYLEKFRLKYNVEMSTRAHNLFMIMMVNEKFRERVQVWEAFEKLPDQFPGFFQHVMETCLEDSIHDYDLREQTALIVFLNHCFNYMEVTLVREQARKLVSLSISLQQGRRDLEFKKKLNGKIN